MIRALLLLTLFGGMVASTIWCWHNEYTLGWIFNLLLMGCLCGPLEDNLTDL